MDKNIAADKMVTDEMAWDKFAWLSHLISFDTTSRNSNLALIEVLKNWFDKHHIQTRLTYSPDKQKANLFATIPSQDGRTDSGLILSGHTDVVPVDKQTWQTDPFLAVKKDERIYGRGSCDMKGFIAVALALTPKMQQLNLPYPIHFALSFDEEVGCAGVPYLIADLNKAGIKPKACIVGEPTSMRPIVAHKGIQLFRCRIHGRNAHSSLINQGCNAIEHAATLIGYIQRMADEYAESGPFDTQFDVPYTTLSTNKIEGGTANNIIPSLCEFYFEFRHLPEVHAELVLHKIRQCIEALLMNAKRKTGLEVDLLNMAGVPAFSAPKDHPLTQLAYIVSGESIEKNYKVAYSTEAGFFQQARIPTIVCGPGNIEQAHKPNEFIEISELDACETFLLKMLQYLARVIR